jgi:hypothetical protein
MSALARTRSLLLLAVLPVLVAAAPSPGDRDLDQAHEICIRHVTRWTHVNAAEFEPGWATDCPAVLALYQKRTQQESEREIARQKALVHRIARDAS